MLHVIVRLDIQDAYPATRLYFTVEQLIGILNSNAESASDFHYFEINCILLNDSFNSLLTIIGNDCFSGEQIAC